MRVQIHTVLLESNQIKASFAGGKASKQMVQMRAKGRGINRFEVELMWARSQLDIPAEFGRSES
eukprot:9784445-Alexandrium_andersonii.AAC.1